MLGKHELNPKDQDFFKNNFTQIQPKHNNIRAKGKKIDKPYLKGYMKAQKRFFDIKTNSI